MPPPVISVEINSVKANVQIKSISKNIANLKLEVNRLGRSVKTVNFSKMGSSKAAADVKTLSSAFNKTSRNTKKLSKGLKDVEKSAKGANKGLKKTQSLTTSLSKSIQVALGPLSGVAARLTAFTAIGTGIGFAFAAIIAGTIAMIAAFVKVVNSGRDMETALLQIEGLIKSTGAAAGVTTQQVDEMSKAIASSTLASVNDVRKASAVLLTFVAITGKEFKETLKIAQDLAQLGFGSIRNAAVQLAKAIEDPRIGLSALRRVGVSFTTSLKEQIIRMDELGRTGEAVALILENLKEQTGGVGEAAAGGLTGAINRLGDAFTQLFENLSKREGLMAFLTNIARNAAVAIEDLAGAAAGPASADLKKRVDDLQKELREREKELRERAAGFGLPRVSRLAFQKELVSRGAEGRAEVEAGIQRQLEPILEKLDVALAELTAFGNRFKDETDKAAAAAVEGAAKRVALNQDKLARSLKGVTERVISGAKAVGDYERQLDILREALNGNVKSGTKAIITQERYNVLIAAAQVRLVNAANSAIFWNKALRAQQKVIDQANRALRRMVDARNRAVEATENQIDSILRESQALLISGKSRKIELEVIKAEIRLKKAGLKVDDEAFINLTKRVREVAKLREEVKQAVRDETEALNDFTRVIGTAFEDALTSGASFRDLLAGIEEDLIRIVTRIAITKPFESALTTAIEGGKLDKDAEGIEQLGFSLGKLLKDIFGFGNEAKQKELAEKATQLAIDEAAAKGKFTISTNLASTAVDKLALAAFKASAALGTIQNIPGVKGIGGGGSIFDEIFQGLGGFGAGQPSPDSLFTIGIDALAKGGVRSSRGSVNLKRFDSGGIASSPSIAVFGEKPGQKEAFVPLPSGDKIPVELSGDQGGGITINGPLMVVQTQDIESFEQSDTQIASGVLAVLQRSQRNT